MTDATESFLIEADADTASAVQSHIESLTPGAASLSERRNFDGSEPTWIVIAQLSAQMLPAVLTFITSLRGPRLPRKLKIGEVEIENPTERDIELALARYSPDG
jgi:hypothetical protein